MLYWIFSFKRYLEQFVMFPFVLWGKWIATKTPLTNDYDIFFFFPGYGIGGAERVNAEIIRSIQDKRIIIFFTKKSFNSGMKHFFELPNVTLKEISYWTDNKYCYWNNFIYRGICSVYINRQKQPPVVFIGQCNFGYKLSPHLRKNIKIIELIHMLDKNFTWVWAPFIKFIHSRIVLAEHFKNAFTDYYNTIGIPQQYATRILVIQNCLEKIPYCYDRHDFSLPLKIYYAGRGGAQKRISLIVEIVRRCEEENLPVVFKLAGPIGEEVPSDFSLEKNIYVGEIKGGEAMYQFHKENDVLLMTSAWEGFPMVIMEAMAYGSIVLTTDVGAIPDYIDEAINGFFINNYKEEKKIIEEAVNKIAFLCNNLNLLKDVSIRAYEFATINFSPTIFHEKYRTLLLIR